MADKMFEVTYLVTREERYRVRAPDTKTAREDAFGTGQFIGSGETTAVEPVGFEEITIT